MSENLGWVCQLADSEAYRSWKAEDLKEARARIAALRAEFAELERKAAAMDGMREWLVAEKNEMHTMFWRLAKNYQETAAAWNTRSHDMGRAVAHLDSLAKGGRDADDVPRTP